MADGFVNQTAERMRLARKAEADARVKQTAEDAEALRCLEERIAAAKAGRDAAPWAVKDDPRRPAAGGIVDGMINDRKMFLGNIGRMVTVQGSRGGVRARLAKETKEHWYIEASLDYIDDGEFVLVTPAWGHDSIRGCVVSANAGVIAKPINVIRNPCQIYYDLSYATPEEMIRAMHAGITGDIKVRVNADVDAFLREGKRRMREIYEKAFAPTVEEFDRIRLKYVPEKLLGKNPQVHAPPAPKEPPTPKGQLPKELQ